MRAFPDWEIENVNYIDKTAISNGIYSVVRIPDRYFISEIHEIDRSIDKLGYIFDIVFSLEG